MLHAASLTRDFRKRSNERIGPPVEVVLLELYIEAATRSFVEFAAVVQECQDADDPPDVPNAELTGLIYASVHGLVNLQIGGRTRQEKGLTDAYKGAELLVELLRLSEGSEKLS